MIKLALIGLGARGKELLKMILLHEKVEVAMVCDIYEDRCEGAVKLIKEKKGFTAFSTQDYKEILEKKPDAILLATAWNHHIDIAIEAMEKGIYVGSEVGGAYSIKQCYQLVEAYERTKTPIMFLENCCYGRNEMMVLNMVRQGVFGEIVHCSGGYLHDLRDEISDGKKNRHYRLENYRYRNAENYPTHELGPIAKILNINHGNRMISLTSIASKSRGLQEFIKEKRADNKELQNTVFKQGDIVTTMITCAGGETICLKLDTTLPRYYSRGFTVQGTKGMFMEENESIFLDNNEEHKKNHFSWKNEWGNIEKFREEYEHPLWKKYLEDGIKEGHGGMDWLVFDDFINSVITKSEVPIDVYDMASLMCITALSEESIALGGAPVMIPDFTNGEWMYRINGKIKCQY